MALSTARIGIGIEVDIDEAAVHRVKTAERKREEEVIIGGS